MKHQNLLLLAVLALVAGMVWMLVPKQPSQLEAAQPGLGHEPAKDWAAAGELRAMGAARQALVDGAAADPASLASTWPAEAWAPVTGRCVDAAGWPVAGVEVLCDGVIGVTSQALPPGMQATLGQRREARSDKNGGFVLDLPVHSLGEARLLFDHPAYGLAQRQLPLAAGSRIDLGDVRLTASCTMLLCIQDESGQRVDGDWQVEVVSKGETGAENVVLPGRFDAELGGYRIDRLPAGKASWRANLATLEKTLYSCASAVGPNGIERRTAIYRGPPLEQRIAFKLRSRLYPELLTTGAIAALLSNPPRFLDTLTGQAVEGPGFDSEGKARLVIKPQQRLEVDFDNVHFEALPRGPYGPGACHELWLRGRGRQVLEIVDAETGAALGPVHVILRYPADPDWDPELPGQRDEGLCTDLGVFPSTFELEGLLPMHQSLLVAADGYLNRRVPLPVIASETPTSLRIELQRLPPVLPDGVGSPMPPVEEPAQE